MTPTGPCDITSPSKLPKDWMYLSIYIYIIVSHYRLLSCWLVFIVRGYVLCTIVTLSLLNLFSSVNLYSFQNLSRRFLNEFKLGADTTLSGKEFHKSTTRRLKKSCLTFNCEDCFCSFREWPQFEFSVRGRNDTSMLYCPWRYLYTSKSPDISYKPLMVDRVVLIGPDMRDLLVQEPILLLDAARSPLM